MKSYLTELVRQKISELGEPQAAEFFEVSPALIRQWVLGTKRISLAAVERVFSTEKLLADHGRVVEAQWEGRQVAILLPFHKQTNPLTTFSLMTILDRAKMATMLQFGDAFIVHTRNQLVAQYLKSGIPESWWLDDDMIPPCGKADWYNAVTDFNFSPEFAGVHTLNRLRESGKTLIGGLYYGRNKSRKPMYGGPQVSEAEMEFAQSAPHDCVKQVPWVATGCLYAKREVYTDIQEKFPELAPQMAGDTWHHFSQSETELTRATEQAMSVLNDVRVTEAVRVREAYKLLAMAKAEVAATKRLRFGEDVTFCKRAAAAGHPAHVDFGVVCGHVGTHVYGPKRTATP